MMKLNALICTEYWEDSKTYRFTKRETAALRFAFLYLFKATFLDAFGLNTAQ